MVVTPGNGRRPGARLAFIGTACVLAVAVVAVTGLAGGGGSRCAHPARRLCDQHIDADNARDDGAAPADDHDERAPTTTTVRYPPSDTTRLKLVNSIGGDISPKSVVASGHGIVLAQNMMYRHTITAYSSAGGLITTIPDSVDLTGFGVADHPGISRGAPVEAALSPDGRDVTSRTTRCTEPVSVPRAATRAHRHRGTATASSIEST